MPFTFSHPAAVLPLGYLPKRWISMTGLIIGSLTPDFEYFIRMKILSRFSHSWFGLFWFDLPLTIILAFIFHQIVRDELIDNLPGFIYKKLNVFKGFNWIKHFKNNFIEVIISCVIGIASHILWDGFTHLHGDFVYAIPALKLSIIIKGLKIPIFKLLQYISSIIGGLIILYVLLKLPANESTIKQKSIIPFRVKTILITLIILTLRFLFGMEFNDYGGIMATTISGGLIGITLISIIHKYSIFGFFMSK